MLRGGLVAAALMVLLFSISGCGDSSADSEEAGPKAHINEETGSTHDLVADERTGPAPPPVKITDLREAAGKAGCFLRTNVKPTQGKELSPGAPTPKYSTDPPASGPYVKAPHQQADGAYLNGVDAIDQLGALNNGRMAIQYAPDLPEDIQLELKGLYDTMYGGTLLFPNDEMQFAVAATTWTNFLGCTSYEKGLTLDALRAFGKATWGKFGSEPVDSLPVEGPTPAAPEEAKGSE